MDNNNNNSFNANNEVLSFFIYMWNRFDKQECMTIFGSDPDYGLGAHVWDKWTAARTKYPTVYDGAAIAIMVGDLDAENLNLLVRRACELYNGRHNR